MLNVATSSALFLSGINYNAYARYSTALGISLISKRTYFRQIKSYVKPVIEMEWIKERSKVIEQRQQDGNQFVIIGDGQYDSPGYSAKFLLYTIMDSITLEVKIQPIQPRALIIT